MEKLLANGSRWEQVGPYCSIVEADGTRFKIACAPDDLLVVSEPVGSKTGCSTIYVRDMLALLDESGYNITANEFRNKLEALRLAVFDYLQFMMPDDFERQALRKALKAAEL